MLILWKVVLNAGRREGGTNHIYETRE